MVKFGGKIDGKDILGSIGRIMVEEVPGYFMNLLNGTNITKA